MSEDQKVICPGAADCWVVANGDCCHGTPHKPDWHCDARGRLYCRHYQGPGYPYCVPTGNKALELIPG